MSLDRLVEEIDAISDAYDKTAVIEGEPEHPRAVREKGGVKRALLDLLYLLLGAGAVGGCLFYSGRVDDLAWLINQYLY